MSTENERTNRNDWESTAAKAVRSALVQMRHGASQRARELYEEAHSLVRTVRRHLEVA